MELLTNTLDNVLAELQECCDRNLMVPHPEKCKAMIIQRQSTYWPYPSSSFWQQHHKVDNLLGVYVDNKSDNKLSWSDHATNIAKSFASKLSFLRRMRFLSWKQLEDFSTKVIMSLVTYGLTVWDRATRRA